MSKSQGFRSFTGVAPATGLCLLQRPFGRSINRGTLVPNGNNNNNLLEKEIKIKNNNGGLRLVSGRGIIKAALATATEPITSVITRVIVKITREITSSTIVKENQAPQKLLKLEFASILLDPSNVLFIYRLFKRND